MKEEILENISKGGYIKPSYLEKINKTSEECFIILYGESNCKYCNSKAKFKSFKQGFNIICSGKECVNKLRKEKTEKTNLERYGVKNVSQIKEIKERKVESSKNTCLERYGVENPFQVPEFMYEDGVHKSQTIDVKLKRDKTNLERYDTTDTLSIGDGRMRGLYKCNNDKDIINKRKDTYLEKYGVEHPFNSKEFQEYLKECIYLKYNVFNISHLPEIKEKISKRLIEICTSEEMKNRRNKVGVDGKTSIEKQKETNILNGLWISDEFKTDYQIYLREVWKITNKQNLYSLENIEKRGHINYNPEAYHLDHKFSIKEGFNQNIDVNIIGDICNLEMIHNKQNTTKREKCSITKDSLLKEYYGTK